MCDDNGRGAVLAVLKNYQAGCVALRRFVPFGVPIAEDRVGVAKRAALEQGVDVVSIVPQLRRLDRMMGWPEVLHVE